MRSRFATSADDSSDDYFGNLTHDFSGNAAGDGSSPALPSFSAWAGAFNERNWGTPIPVSALTGEAQQAMAAQSGPVNTVSVSMGTGFTINLLYDAAAMAAPQSFRNTIQQAANLLAASITDPITVNIKIDYSGTGGGAAAGPDAGLYEPYSLVRSNLIANVSPGDPVFNSLPAGTSIQGQSQVAVWNAQLKLWGLLSPNDATTDDGSATFATDINSNLLLGVALHELTHAMGRVPYGPQPDIFDLFRFTSSGVRLFNGAATAPAAYFSLDNGVTKLADYGKTSDSSDFLNSGIQGPNDPFNEFYSGTTLQKLTTVDLKQMDALGFHLTSAAGTVIGPTADIMWFNSGTGQFTVWESTGSTYLPNVYVSAVGAGWALAGAADFSGDGKADLLWFNNTTHQFTEWQATGSGFTQNVYVSAVGAAWALAGTGDFSGDGKADLLWLNSATGQFTEWQSTGSGFTQNVYVSAVGPGWALAGTGDFSGDGKADLIWFNSATGQFTEWQSTGSGFTQNVYVSAVGAGWTLAGTGDFNGDGKADLIWQNGSTFTEWQSTGNGFTKNVFVGSAGAGMTLAGTGDFNGDGKADLLWLNNTTHQFTEWTSTGNGFTANVYTGSVSAGWTIAANANLTTTQSGQSMGVVAQQASSNAWDGVNDNFAFNLASGTHTASIGIHSDLNSPDISAQFAHATALQSLFAGAVDGNHTPLIDLAPHDGGVAGANSNPDPNGFLHHSFLLG